MVQCRCSKTWTSLVWAHCSVCHETFSRPRNFDTHRKNGVCTFGPELELRDGVWRARSSDEKWYEARWETK